MEIKLGPYTFKTKKAAKEFIRASLEPRIFNPLDPIYFELIERHHERDAKIGVGIKYFELDWRELSKTFEPTIVRLDGSKIDFSWVRCLSQSWKSSEDNLREAMRCEIVGQILAFKGFENTIICPLCKNRVSGVHVDHIKPFEELVRNFLKDKKPPTTFDDCGDTKRALFKPKDREFADAWADYHRRNAELRLICIKCNLTRARDP